MKTKSILLTAILACATSGAFAAASTTAPTPLLTQSEPTLIGVLKSSSDRKEKADACRELAVVGTSKAVPVLAGMLADEEFNHMARYALETIPGPGVGQALRDELPRLKGRPLVGVIGSLGVRKDLRAVKPLAGLLADPDPQVAQAATRALGQIATAEAVQAIEKALPTTAPGNRLAFCEGLFRSAESFAARGKTKDAIALYDRLRALTDVPHQVSAGALRGGIITRGSGDLGLLKESLASNDRVLFNAAVRASMEMSSPQVTRVLTASLPQLPPDNQIVLMQAVGNRRDEAAVSTLSTLAKMGGNPTRVASIRALSAIGSAAAVASVAELIEYPDAEISQAAVVGLSGMPGRESDAIVINMIKSPNAEQRVIGIELAGRRGMATAVPALLIAATDSNAKVKASALQKLGKLGTPAEVPALLSQLSRSTDPQELAGLAEALSSICTRAGSPASATEQITAALSGGQPAQKAALLSVLGAVGGEKALATVRAALKDPSAEVHDAAVRALSEWPDPSLAPDLLQIVRSTTSGGQRDVAFRGYVRLVGESTATPAEKARMMREVAALAGAPQEKMLVLAGTGDIVSTESLKLAATFLSDAALADEAGAAAVKIASKLPASDKAEIGTVLNQVLKSAKSAEVLNQARKRMKELGITPE